MKNHLDYLEQIIQVLKKNKTSTTDNSDIIVTSKIAINEKFSADARRYPLEVEGVAFIPGEYKKVVYTSEELQNPLTPLDGKICDINHNNIKIGNITTTKFENNRLYYNGLVTDKETADAIYDLKITKVSPSFSIKDRVPENDKVYAKGIIFKGMSFLKGENPVIDDTTIYFE